MLKMTNMDSEIKVRNVELRLGIIQYAIVTLESGDKFAVRGKLKDNLIDFMVEEIDTSISPYYMIFGSQVEYDKAYNHYLTVRIITDLQISSLENRPIYDMVKEYEYAIADAIIDYSKLHTTDFVIHFGDYPKPPTIIMTDIKGKIKVKKIEMDNSDIYARHAIVTLESGDKFAVSGEFDNNLVVLRVDEIKNSITPYYITLGSQESTKAYNHYLAAGVIKEVKIHNFENRKFYEMVREYEYAIADAIIDHSKSHNMDTIIRFINYQKSSIP